MPNSVQRKLGYTDVIYNKKTGKFYENAPGDNYEQLNISSGGDGSAGGVGVTTADVTLVNPTSYSNLPDMGGLLTQSDLNAWVYESLTALDVDGDGEVNLDGYATEAWVESKNYITLAEVPVTNLDDYATEAWVEGKNYITLAEVPATNLAGYATEAWVEGKNYLVAADLPNVSIYAELYNTEQIITAKEFIGDGSQLTGLPEPVLEGALIFQGSVDTEASLPSSGNEVGHLWLTEDTDTLHAWGEDDAWHEVGSATDVNLDEYAKLDDGMQKITAAFFQTDNPNCYVYGGGFKGPNAEVQGLLEVGGQLQTRNISAYDDSFYISDVAGLTFKNNDAYIKDLQALRFLDDPASAILDLSYIQFQNSGDTSIANVKYISGLPSGDAITINSPLEGSDATFSGTIQAIEFIGDGSQLTNLPTGGAANLDEYAKLDGVGSQEIINTNKFQCSNTESYLDNTTLKTVNGEFTSDVTVQFNVKAAKFLVQKNGDDLITASQTQFKVDLDDGDGVTFQVLEDAVIVGGDTDNAIAQVNVPLEVNGGVLVNNLSTFSGNCTFQGYPILVSDNGTEYKLKVADDGTLSTEAV